MAEVFGPDKKGKEAAIDKATTEPFRLAEDEAYRKMVEKKASKLDMGTFLETLSTPLI